MLPDPRASRVVIIGTAKYEDESWAGRQLDAVRANVSDLTDLFRDGNYWGLPPENCISVIDPESREALIDPIRAAAAEATDTLLVYYAGHGFLCARDGASKLHLTVTKTVDRDRLHAVEFDLVREAVSRSPARRRILILDCCHAGVALSGMGAAVDRKPLRGTYVLAAVSPDAGAVAPPNARYTAFTGELLALLRDGVADGGPALTLDDLFDHLWKRLAARGLPEPWRSNVGTVGDLPLVRNRAEAPGARADLLAIDFGTSNTTAALRLASGTVRPLRFDDLATLPSAVALTPDGGYYVGGDAIRYARARPAAFQSSPKRHIGRALVELDGYAVPVADLVAQVLKRVAVEAHNALGHQPGRLVLTHPYTWGPRHRAVLEAAAFKAGLPPPQFVSEPLAAATYVTRRPDHDIRPGALLVVYDFGGGTFDVSTVRRVATPAVWEVVRCDGLENTGGVNLDEVIVEWFGRQIEKHDPVAWQRLRTPTTEEDRQQLHLLVEDARLAKERLSTDISTRVFLKPVNADVDLTRAEFEELAADIIEQTVRRTAAAIAGSDAGPDEVAAVVLIGGSSRIPLVTRRLEQLTGTLPRIAPEPELVVSEGALHHFATAPVAPPPRPVVNPWTALLSLVCGLCAGGAAALYSAPGVPGRVAAVVSGLAITVTAYLLFTHSVPAIGKRRGPTAR
ncbi:hypothetical protein Val02_05880 [Virgisporangium aliadipatigenens]|uniref:Peptidase C14 caspase domain-containing protein n=1 Tax=Virgisporangium aliadipatigenens TaxID=741659 RepID=A0A8J3YGA2_9ACTN|nr:Hsp70 family protein [Virgisporangium aliadipatigenens]GIJ43702.1 hypothetical protein Val02_05880 [Virgisporangium aliadipatigenens]